MNRRGFLQRAAGLVGLPLKPEQVLEELARVIAAKPTSAEKLKALEWLIDNSLDDVNYARDSYQICLLSTAGEAAKSGFVGRPLGKQASAERLKNSFMGLTSSVEQAKQFGMPVADIQTMIGNKLSGFEIPAKAGEYYKELDFSHNCQTAVNDGNWNDIGKKIENLAHAHEVERQESYREMLQVFKKAWKGILSESDLQFIEHSKTSYEVRFKYDDNANNSIREVRMGQFKEGIENIFKNAVDFRALPQSGQMFVRAYTEEIIPEFSEFFNGLCASQKLRGNAIS